MPFKEATGTSLGALLLPVGLLGAITYYRSGNLDPKASLLVAAGILFGAYALTGGVVGLVNAANVKDGRAWTVASSLLGIGVGVAVLGWRLSTVTVGAAGTVMGGMVMVGAGVGTRDGDG